MFYFDWDLTKAKTNIQKHRVRFEEAMTAFDDPYAYLTLDAEHSLSELREWLIGISDRGRVLVVVFTKRGKLFRIISARLANKKERKFYENIRRISI